uniref:Uncharacterized protein n=1 Tax=Helianthus annuus TaxID=4232 RepID=A0A251T5C6_HELAN
MQLEHELKRARQQGMFIAGGVSGDQVERVLPNYMLTQQSDTNEKMRTVLVFFWSRLQIIIEKLQQMIRFGTNNLKTHELTHTSKKVKRKATGFLLEEWRELK